MTTPTLKELLKSVEGELWIRSLEDVVCVWRRGEGGTYRVRMYLRNGVEVEVLCDPQGCEVAFVGRRLSIENLDELLEGIEGIVHVE